MGSCDVFVSVAGGVRVNEPGADLGIALAVASAARGVPLGDERPLAAYGEVGLTGELRHVAHPDRREAEAEKFGLAPLGPGRLAVASPCGPRRSARGLRIGVRGRRAPGGRLTLSGRREASGPRSRRTAFLGQASQNRTPKAKKAPTPYNWPLCSR